MSAFRFDPDLRAIAVPVTVTNDAGEQRMANLALDPGSSATTLPMWLVSELRLAPVQDRQAELTTISGRTQGGFFRVPRLELLGRACHAVEAVGIDLPARASVDGLVGLGVLRDFKLLLNFPKGKLLLLPREPSVFRRFIEILQLLWLYW